MPTHFFGYQRYEDIFDEADTNNDGFIDLEDLRKICRKYGYSGPLSQLKRCMTEANTSGDGTQLSYVEYMRAMGLEPRERIIKVEAAPPPQSAMQMEVLKQIFMAFDQDGNGTIDRNELQQVFKELGKKYSKDQVQRMIDMIDKDGTGTLNYEEFLVALRGNHLVD